MNRCNNKLKFYSIFKFKIDVMWTNSLEPITSCSRANFDWVCIEFGRHYVWQTSLLQYCTANKARNKTTSFPGYSLSKSHFCLTVIATKIIEQWTKDILSNTRIMRTTRLLGNLSNFKRETMHVRGTNTEQTTMLHLPVITKPMFFLEKFLYRDIFLDWVFIDFRRYYVANLFDPSAYVIGRYCRPRG